MTFVTRAAFFQMLSGIPLLAGESLHCLLVAASHCSPKYSGVA